MTAPALTPALAARFAQQALDNIGRAYPHKLDHVLGGPGDAQEPRALHPSFHGSYDWHSCVHMHWLLAHLVRRVPGADQRPAIVATFDRHLAPAAIAAEVAYLAGPHNASFVRTYGWAWLLKLAHEFAEGAPDDPDAARWSAALAPLARAFTARWLDFLPRTQFPDPPRQSPQQRVRPRVRAWTTRAARGLWRWNGRSSPRRWPGTAPTATAPRRGSLPAPISCAAGAGGGRPDAAGAGRAGVRALARRLPAGTRPRRARRAVRAGACSVSDRGDPQIVHLDGLNLVRAWTMRGIASALPPDDPRRARCSSGAAHATSRRAWPASPAATTRGSTGWRRSRRWPAAATGMSEELRGAARIDAHERTAAHRRRGRRRHRWRWSPWWRSSGPGSMATELAVLKAQGQDLERDLRQDLAIARGEQGAAAQTLRAEVGERVTQFTQITQQQFVALTAAQSAELKAFGERLAQFTVATQQQLSGSTQAQSDQLKAFGERFAQFTQTTQQALGTGAAAQAEQAKVTAERIGELAKSNEQRLEAVRATVEQRLDTLRTENAAKLDQMRADRRRAAWQTAAGPAAGRHRSGR